MLPVTFYSYKGGVGRTMALLNVAAIVARRGLEVAVLDLDLEAPGLGLSESTRGLRAPEDARLGASDFVFDRIEGHIRPVSDYGDEHELEGGKVFLIPAGQRASRLAREIAGFYASDDDDRSYALPLLLAEIEHERRPDLLLIDSRTGRADIAGVCAMDLPRVLVAVCGLSEQNIYGMGGALREIWAHHDKAERGVLTLLAASPIPRPRDVEMVIGQPPEAARSFFAEAPFGVDLPFDHPLMVRRQLFRTRLIAPVQGRAESLRQDFPLVRVPQDIVHELPYDPAVPFLGELIFERRSPLFQAYQRLADALWAATGRALPPRDEPAPRIADPDVLRWVVDKRNR